MMNIKADRCFNYINMIFGIDSGYKTEIVYIQDTVGVKITRDDKVFLVKVNEKNYNIIYKKKYDVIKSIPSWIIGLQKEE